MNLFQSFILELILAQSSLVAQRVKNLLAMQETWVQSLGWEDPLKEGVATLPGKFPWIQEPDGVQSMGSQSCTRLNE